MVDLHSDVFSGATGAGVARRRRRRQRGEVKDESFLLLEPREDSKLNAAVRHAYGLRF